MPSASFLSRRQRLLFIGILALGLLLTDPEQNHFFHQIQRQFLIMGELHRILLIRFITGQRLFPMLQRGRGGVEAQMLLIRGKL